MKIIEVDPKDSRIRRDLLHLADPSSDSIAGYISDSNVFVGSLEGRTIAMGVLRIKDGMAELMNIAVDTKYQKRGNGGKMITHIKHYLEEHGIEFVSVGTGNSSLDQLAFYQRHGFRMEAIRKNYFESYQPPIYENGIRCIDMVVLKAETKKGDPSP